MADFKIGDRVRVIGLNEEDRVGEIVADGDPPSSVKVEDLVARKEVEEVSVRWWKVRLDETGEEEDIPDDRLEKLVVYQFEK